LVIGSTTSSTRLTRGSIIMSLNLMRKTPIIRTPWCQSSTWPWLTKLISKKSVIKWNRPTTFKSTKCSSLRDV
jgi:hypothetical protein